MLKNSGKVVTIYDIAAELGLSTSTVSRSLNNSNDVNKKTLKRVLDASCKMGYTSNLLASGLRNRRSNTIGVIIPRLNSAFMSGAIAGIENIINQAGYNLVISQSLENVDKEVSCTESMLSNRVAGLIVSLAGDIGSADHFESFEKHGVPVVFFDRVPVEEDCDKVCFDDVQVAEMIARLIIAKQKKHVLAILWASRLVSTTRKREQAFRAYMQQYGPDISVQFSFQNELEKKTDHIIAEARQITRSALMGNNRPDTIFCSGDLTLIGVMEAIQEMELKTPDTIAVISLSNGFIPKLYYPKITHVETSGYKLGKLAYSRIMDYEKGNTQPRELFVESVLVEGQSI